MLSLQRELRIIAVMDMRNMRWKQIPILILILLLLCSSAFAEGQAELRLTGMETDGQYRVIIDLVGTDSIEMLQFCVSYDADLLELKQVQVGSAFNGVSYPTISSDIDGKVFFAWDALKPLKAGRLLIIEFVARDDAFGTAEIRIDAFEEFIAADENYQSIDINRNSFRFELAENDASVETEVKPQYSTETDIREETVEIEGGQLSPESERNQLQSDIIAPNAEETETHIDIQNETKIAQSNNLVSGDYADVPNAVSPNTNVTKIVIIISIVLLTIIVALAVVKKREAKKEG